MRSADTETTGLDLKHDARPFFVTICKDTSPEEPLYWEWLVDPLTRMPSIPEGDIEEIRSEILDEGDELVLQNAKFDAAALKSINCIENWPWKKTYDTLLSGHLLSSNQPHDLTTMALIYLGVNIKPYEEALKEAVNEARRYARSKHPTWRIAKEGMEGNPSAKGSCWGLDMWLPRCIAHHDGFPEDHPWWTVLRDYSLADSMVTLPLFTAHAEKLEDRGLWEIYEERRKVIPIIFGMESRGVTLSKDRTYELKDTYTKSATKASNICCNLSNGKLTEMPAGVNNKLREVIFDDFKLVPSKTTDKGAPSLDKFVLDEWLVKLPERSKQYTFIKNLRAYRKRQTALSYIKTYENYWIPLGITNEKGEQGWYLIYPSLNPTGTSTLRFSSENPNSQQISKQEIEEFSKDERDEDHVNRSARYMFGPAPGREWWSCDAQNIELRLPAYESGEQAMIDLFERPKDPPYFGSNHLFFFDILHPDKWDRSNPEGLLQAKEDYADTWYQWTKNGNFAVQYGAVAESGTADRAYHVPGGQAKIESKLTNIKKLSLRMIEMAEEYGYVETIPDKTVNPLKGYPLECTRTKWGRIMPTVPLSYHIQGTAMWWMMKGMIRVQEYLDELNRKCKCPNQYRMVMQIHDELVFDFPKGKGPEPWKTNLKYISEIRRLMALGGDDISVPTPVSCKYHPNDWGTGKSVS